MVTIDTKTHIYKDETGIRYYSVTQILKRYKVPFDADGKQAIKSAAKKGVTVEEIKRQWKEAGDVANSHGTNVHKSLQDYVEQGLINEEHKKIIASFIKLGINDVRSEEIVSHQGLKIAGTVDLIERYKDRINIYDFKTNKQIRKFSEYGNRFLPPISHLEECEYINYALQLSLYAWMLEQKGEKIGKLAILWINPKTQEMEEIPTVYMKETVMNLIKDFNIKRASDAN